MKIATRLKLAALVPALLALVIGSALFFSYKAVQEAQVEDRAAQQIISSMNKLSSLISDYVLYHEERPLQQFMAEHDSIVQFIAAARFNDEQRQQILDSIRRDIVLMNDTFRKLVSNHEYQGSARGTELMKEVENRLAGRLFVWAGDVVADASYLERLIDETLTTTQKKTSLLIFLLIVATTLFLTLVLMGMTRHIATSLMLLRKGAEAIGAGNLGHRIGMAARDEIGELARSFDHMTEHLQAVTVSKYTLEQEVEERKKVQAAVREQHEWLRVTLSSIGDAVMTADTGGRITFLNPVAAALTGWPLEEAEARPIQSVLRTLNELTREPAEDIVKRVLTEGCVVNMANHTALVHRDGSEIPIEDSAAPIKDGAGNLLGVVIVFHNITEKRRAQEALRQSEEKFRIVADFTYDWEYWRSSDNRFLYVSPSCDRVTGYSQKEFLDDLDLYSRIVHPEDRERVLEHLREDQFHRELCELEFRILHRDGRVRWIAHACRPVLGENEKILGRRASNRDITERKLAEEDLRQRSLELQQLTETLEQRVKNRTAALAKANDALRDLSARLLSAQEEERKSIAGDLHDTIGSCLTAIKFKVEHVLSQTEKTANPAAMSLNTIIPVVQEGIEECRRMQQDLRPSMLDDLGLLPALSWFCRSFQTIYSGIRIEQDIDLREDDIPQMLKIVVFRVIQEAMNNIAKHSKADLVHFSLRKRDESMELVLQDNGRGFSVEKINSQKTAGKGLGLTSMRERAGLSGGSFNIESVEGKGTIIRASWPFGKTG